MIIQNVVELKSGKILQIRPLDAYRLSVDVSNIALIEAIRNESNDISSITIDEHFTFSVGDEIKMKIGNVRTSYMIHYIAYDKKEKTILLLSSMPNKTTAYILPLLNKNKIQLKFDSYFINAYVDTKKENICLLYRFTGTELYKSFEEQLLKDNLCIKHIDNDPYHVIYVFKIPEQFKKDIEYFFEGKYSKFSSEAKKRIQKFYGSKDAIPVQVIYKNLSLRKELETSLSISIPENIELASKPIIEQEVYNL